MRKTLLATLSLLALAVSTLANAQTPKPGPDTRKLEAFVGTWKYAGDAKASPLGPATKIAGTQTGRMVMGGFVLEWKGEEKGPFGDVQWGEMDVYDASSKSYPYFGYQNDGMTWSGSTILRGDIWAAAGTFTSRGTSYKFKSEGSFSADGNTWTWKSEISTDGKTWVPWTQGTMTKSM